MDINNEKIAGFTIIELIAIVMIISILAVLTVFSWQGTTINLEAQAQQIANDIRYAQSLAMTKGVRYRWVRASSTTYQIVNSSGTPITFARGNTTITLNSGITFGAFTNLPNNLVAFNGKGIPYTDTGSPGTALAAAATIPITQSSETESIVISPGTGRVIVQ